jgi:acid phosphatase (class A)
MRPTTNPNPEAVGESWDVQNTGGDYRSREDELKFQQLAKAGYRLAEVLKSIWPDAGPVVTPTTKGYLPASQLASIKVWLPRKPLAKSTAQADDVARFKNSRALLSKPRGQSAAEDDVFEPSQVVERFNEALGLVLNADNSPTLMAMLKKIEEDANQLVAPVKVKVKDGGRVRPFVAYPKLPSCLSPKDLAGHRDSDINIYHLDQSGAYPSTHALVGMMVAMVMSEVVPERADNLLARGYEFGESRMVCGFHYNTDLVAGRLAASALYSRLHASEAFLADLAKLRQEVARVNAGLH